MRRQHGYQAMSRTTILTVALATLASACARTPESTTARVERLTVRVAPVSGGDVLVREVFTLAPGASDGAMRFHRVIDIDRADSVDVVAISANGQRIEPGTRGLAVTRRDAGRVEIAWVSDSTAPVDFVIDARAKSGVAVTQPRAGLTIPVLVAGRGYDVGEVEVHLVLSSGATTYDGTGMLEAGWAVERTPTGIVARRAHVSDAESATLVATFDFDRQGVPDPTWERNLDRQRQFMPAFIAGAAFFLVVGVGALVILRLQYPRRLVSSNDSHASSLAAEREGAVRGLRLTAAVGMLVAIACAVVSATVLSFFGPWLQAIPASIAAVSLLFLTVAPIFRR